MKRSYFGGLYTREKHGLTGARDKAEERLGAIIFEMPRDRAWQEAHASAIAEILEWYESGDEADRPTILGKPCDYLFIDILDGSLERQNPLVPQIHVDHARGQREFDHYMSGRAGRPGNWRNPPHHADLSP